MRATLHTGGAALAMLGAEERRGRALSNRGDGRQSGVPARRESARLGKSAKPGEEPTGQRRRQFAGRCVGQKEKVARPPFSSHLVTDSQLRPPLEGRAMEYEEAALKEFDSLLYFLAEAGSRAFRKSNSDAYHRQDSKEGPRSPFRTACEPRPASLTAILSRPSFRAVGSF